MPTRSSRSSSLSSALAAVAAASALLAAPLTARADLPEASAAYPLRPNNPSKPFALTQLAAPSQGVNVADCENANDVIVFSFDLATVASWQSADSIRFYSSGSADSCQDASVRSDGAVTSTGSSVACNRVAAFALSYLQGASTGELGIPLSLVVAGVTSISSANVPYSNTDLFTDVTATTRRTFTEASLDLTKYCNPVAFAGGGPQAMYLHAILFQGELPLGTAVVGGDAGVASSSTVEATQRIDFDLWGPQPPTGLSLGVGDAVLYANWTGPASSPDLAGYAAYCASNAATAGGADAGTTDAACPTGLPADLGAGVPVAADLASLQCGASESSAGPTMSLAGLTDGRDYAVFVAGVDTYGNPGPLSSEVCGAPMAASAGGGGAASGGSCTIARGAPGGSIAALVVACAGMLVARRARRRSSAAAR